MIIIDVRCIYILVGSFGLDNCIKVCLNVLIFINIKMCSNII